MINSKELDSYINYISHYKVDKNIVGAIVMNANPFTNGHRYLIEKALEEVEYLYVFVVESNRCSSYDYMEREWMVRKSTEDLKMYVFFPEEVYLHQNLVSQNISTGLRVKPRLILR